MWHRVEISELLPDHLVKIIFVDIGITRNVKYSDLKKVNRVRNHYLKSKSDEVHTVGCKNPLKTSPKQQ